MLKMFIIILLLIWPDLWFIFIIVCCCQFSLLGDVSKHFQAEIKAVFIYITMPSMSI